MDDSPTPTEREREQIDRLLDQFEKQYQRRSTPPRIEDYVDRHPAIAKELLAELLVLDVRLRFINSEMPHPEEYKTRFPEQVDLIDRVLNSRDPHLTSLSTKLHFGSNPDSGSLSTRCIESTESGDTCSMEIDTAARNESSVEAGKAETDVEVPELFGRYQIERRLGAGAMGTVYLTFDSKLKRKAAIKIPKFYGEDAALQKARFCREAQVAAGLRHPNICPVYDFGEVQGKPYISLAYIEGSTLAELSRHPAGLSLYQACRWVKKIAEGLDKAHRSHIVHRDLKPGNIMVDQDGEPMIMDFGLARNTLDSDQEQLTRTGIIVGTPAYMSPEQVDSSTSTIGPASDQYALGVIFYELLTATPLRRGSLSAIITQITTVNPAAPSEITSNVDPELDDICLKMLARDKCNRFESCQQVADQIERYLEHADQKNLDLQLTHAVNAENKSAASQSFLKSRKWMKASHKPALLPRRYRSWLLTNGRWIAAVALIAFSAGAFFFGAPANRAGDLNDHEQSSGITPRQTPALKPQSGIVKLRDASAMLFPIPGEASVLSVPEAMFLQEHMPPPPSGSDLPIETWLFGVIENTAGESQLTLQWIHEEPFRGSFVLCVVDAASNYPRLPIDVIDQQQWQVKEAIGAESIVVVVKCFYSDLESREIGNSLLSGDDPLVMLKYSLAPTVARRNN